MATNKTESNSSKILLTLTTIYGVLYAAMIVGFLITETPIKEIFLEVIIVSIAIIFFFIGYYYSWKNELIAGIIFIFWWAIMWYLGLFVAEIDKGAGAVMGFPMFIIGVLFIISHYRRQERTDN